MCLIWPAKCAMLFYRLVIRVCSSFVCSTLHILNKTICDPVRGKAFFNSMDLHAYYFIFMICRYLLELFYNSTALLYANTTAKNIQKKVMSS